MKRLEDMSRDELLQLTDETAATLIDLECAYAGAPLSIAKPLYNEVPDIPEPDVIYYEVAGMKFTDKKEADALADFINGLSSQMDNSYDYDIPGYGKYSYKSDKRPDPVFVDAGRTYSKAVYSELKEIIRQRATAEEENKKLMNEFNQKQKARADVAKEIRDAIRKAQLEVYEIQEKAKLYNRYLFLAGGDTETARNFYIEHYGGEAIPAEVLQEAAKQKEETED